VKTLLCQKPAFNQELAARTHPFKKKGWCVSPTPRTLFYLFSQARKPGTNQLARLRLHPGDAQCPRHRADVGRDTRAGG